MSITGYQTCEVAGSIPASPTSKYLQMLIKLKPLNLGRLRQCWGHSAAVPTATLAEEPEAVEGHGDGGAHVC